LRRGPLGGADATLTIKKATLAQRRLLFIVSALRRLVAAEHFTILLRVEAIQSMPLPLAEDRHNGRTVMAPPVKAAFERQIVVLPICSMLPLRTISFSLKQSVKYQRIAHSIISIKPNILE
jgi:hypothetical protein